MENTAAILAVESGPEQGQIFPLLRGVNTIGLQVGNDLRISDEGISRNHAEVVETNRGHVLFDNSTNGTFVNGVQVPEGGHLLADGDRIQLGPSESMLAYRSDFAQTREFPKVDPTTYR